MTEDVAGRLAALREACALTVEEIGIREAAHGHGVSGSTQPTDFDFEQAKRGCHYCLRVKVLAEAVEAIRAVPLP